MLLEFEKMQKKTKQELQEMDKRALKAEKQRDDALYNLKELQPSFMKLQSGWKKNREKI